MVGGACSRCTLHVPLGLIVAPLYCCTSILQVYTNALQCLSQEDRTLPFLERMLPLLKRGIGVHHSGAARYPKGSILALLRPGLAWRGMQPAGDQPYIHAGLGR